LGPPTVFAILADDKTDLQRITQIPLSGALADPELSSHAPRRKFVAVQQVEEFV